MKHSFDRRLALLGLGLFALLFFLLPRSGPDVDWVQAERAKLERWQQHAAPGSLEEMKLARKLGKLDAFERGEPEAGHPDLFAELHAQMRTPSDREFSEYQPGYMIRELSKAKAKAGPAKALLPWVNRGPGNVAGRARGIVVDPDDPTGQTWFYAAVGGGVWRTSDGGSTWTGLTDEQPHLQDSAIAMSPANTSVLYAGTGEAFYNVDTLNGNGILKSTDKGATWTHLAATIDDPRFNNISRIIVDPADEDVLVVSATTGRYKESLNGASSIFRSTDGGATFAEVYRETDVGSFARVKKIQQVIADPSNFLVQYAAVDEKGVLKSTDGGQTWSLSNSGITDFGGRFELAIHPVQTNRLYAALEGSGGSELFISTDFGATWTQTAESGTPVNWLGAQGWYDNTIVCHPTDPNVVYVGGIRLYQISLSGSTRTTTSLNTGPVHVDNHNLVVVQPSGGGWFLLNANDGGVGVSSSQATGWSAPIDGMTTTQFYGVDKRPGASAYVGGMQDNGTWRSPIDSDRLDPWFLQIGGDGYETSWHFDDVSKIIGGYQFNGLMRSLDGGLTWIDATNGLTDTGGANAPFITKIGKTNLDPDLLFAVGASGVWRSTDFGGSWTSIPISSGDWGGLSSFHDIRVSRADPDYVIAGSRMDASGNVMVSTDRGLSFSATNQYATQTMGRISGLATHPTDPQTLFALFSFAGRPKILRTADLGSTWQDISGVNGPTGAGFPDVAVYDLLVFPDDTDRIWAGTEIGLFESLDGGNTWALANNGLPNVGIWMLRQVEDEVVVATHGRGIWSVQIPSMVANLTFNPLFESIAQTVYGPVEATFNLRSTYDQVEFYVNGGLTETVTGNAAGQTYTVSVPVAAAGPVSVQAVGTKSSQTYASVTKTIDAVLLAAPAYSYVNDFNVASDDFVGTGFEVRSEAGFANEAIHTPHFYNNGETLTYMLKNPIIVASQDARFEYDEIALIEPGEPGSVFGDFEFWDYVIVEGSQDGVQWTPLLDGYDSREDVDWESTYYAGTSPTSSLFRHRTIDLLQSFSAGDRILVRFRFFADEAVNGWGWVIDNLEIQDGSTAVEGPSALRFALAEAVPNPFNPSTTIAFHLPVRDEVSLDVYDVRGRHVRSLVRETLSAGEHSVKWDGRDDAGRGAASGVYLYRLRAGDQLQQKKMTLLK